jgi:hypothetical protein
MQPPRPFASSRSREYRPGLKPIEVEAFFRWTEVQLPLLKQGAPTQRQVTLASLLLPLKQRASAQRPAGARFERHATRAGLHEPCLQFGPEIE